MPFVVACRSHRIGSNTALDVFKPILSDEQNLIIHDVPLGRGGEAEVKLATLISGDGTTRSVAVKIFYPKIQQKPGFSMEADNYARLPRHRNVLEAYGAGTLAYPGHEERCFIVLKLVKKSLRDVAREDDEFRCKCSFGDLVEIFLDAANGLHHIHKHCMVHLDFKPANILINQNGTAMVADFGMATVKKGMRSSVSPEHFGTPGYWAPETFIKLCEKESSARFGTKSHISVSEYSDVYSLE